MGRLPGRDGAGVAPPGTGDFVDDYRLRFRPVDLVGVPIGVLTQLVLVPLVYLPLEAIWDQTFTDDQLSENAEKLVDRAHGCTMVLLVLMVCVGAPIVEELVYRGLLQGSFAARVAGYLAVLGLGGCVRPDPLPAGRVPRPVRVRPGRRRVCLLTGRLGMSIATHVASTSPACSWPSTDPARGVPLFRSTVERNVALARSDAVTVGDDHRLADCAAAMSDLP